MDKITHTTIVTSPPDWFVATFVAAKGDIAAHFLLDPIIAWEIKRREIHPHGDKPTDPPVIRHGSVPITLDGDDNGFIIKRPDGQFEIGGSYVFTEAEALEFAVRTHAGGHPT